MPFDEAVLELVKALGDRVTVKITGGTNGDVAGNAIRLLLERCPEVEILNIVAGAGALFDPMGADREELGRLILKHDIVDHGIRGARLRDPRTNNI